jgi:hypothetical protein
MVRLRWMIVGVVALAGCSGGGGGPYYPGPYQTPFPTAAPTAEATACASAAPTAAPASGAAVFYLACSLSTANTVTGFTIPGDPSGTLIDASTVDESEPLAAGSIQSPPPADTLTVSITAGESTSANRRAPRSLRSAGQPLARRSVASFVRRFAHVHRVASKKLAALVMASETRLGRPHTPPLELTGDAGCDREHLDAERERHVYYRSLDARVPEWARRHLGRQHAPGCRRRPARRDVDSNDRERLRQRLVGRHCRDRHARLHLVSDRRARNDRLHRIADADLHFRYRRPSSGVRDLVRLERRFRQLLRPPPTSSTRTSPSTASVTRSPTRARASTCNGTSAVRPTARPSNCKKTTSC